MTKPYRIIGLLCGLTFFVSIQAQAASLLPAGVGFVLPMPIVSWRTVMD